jgi:hypothetical protein
MGTSAGNGTFITKIATARIFGLITNVQGKYDLTDIGASIIDSDEKRQKEARAKAFLAVPLYRRVYEEFKGRQLPPRPRGLEQAFAKFGVPPKQTYIARLAFDKSAKQAGFFGTGPERLIEPIIGASMGDKSVGLIGVSAVGTAGEIVHVAGVGSAPSGDDLDLDPLVRGLLRRLPKPGENWELEKRARWLQTLAANFDMVYVANENGKLIVVECKVASKSE